MRNHRHHQWPSEIEEEEEKCQKGGIGRRRSEEVLTQFVQQLLLFLLFSVEKADGIPAAAASGFALIEHMNRFSTVDKLNRTRPAGAGNAFGTTGHGGQQQSYKDQLLSVILQQNAANGSSFSPPSSPSLIAAAPSSPVDHPSHEPNGNMKSKDFGNGEGELDMLFGFFVMNGACIVFFLLFGVCVICNCAARKPKFHGSEQKEKKRKKPTVSRLVAAMAPPGFGQRAKANAAAAAAAAAAKEQQNGNSATNIPLLQAANSMGSRRGSTASIRLDQNGNGGAGGPSPLLANHLPAQRSFRPLLPIQSLVTKALASAKAGASPTGRGSGGGGSLAVNIDSDADSQPPEPMPAIEQQQQQQRRRQSRDAQGIPSGGNSPARRMSALSSAIEESSRRISKLSHCSANECCSLHVLEVPVEVEVHHCPSPTGGPSLIPELAAALGAHHPKLACTRSMPFDDLARVAKLPPTDAADRPQQICLTEHGQFIVRREEQRAWAVGGPSRHSFRSSRHRCSLVVPLQIPCGECRVQISPDEEEEEEGAESGKAMSAESGVKLGEEEGKMEEEEQEGSVDDGGGGSRKPSASGEFSVVRQNLLGPLSFDDLYYIT